MPARVVVFVDYQNVYGGARELFHPSRAPYWEGQVEPLRLGEALARRSSFDRELTGVRIYRGRPDSGREPQGYAANLRQCDA